MANLTKKEIVAELNKLGINATSEIDLYYAEYAAYSAKYSQVYFIRILQRFRRKRLLRKNATSPNLLKDKYLSRLRNNS